MTFEKGNFVFFIAFILIGAILGSALGTFLSDFFPVLSIIKKSLTGPIGFNLDIISLHFNLNISSIVGIILAVIIFRKI
jgi:hypothetical protein